MDSRLLTIISTILLIGTITQCFRNHKLKNQLREINTSQSEVTFFKTETVYIEKPFKVDKPYNETVKPKKVTVYKSISETDKVSEKVGWEPLVQFKLDKNLLDLTRYLSSDSKVVSKRYRIDLDKFSYSFQNGNLTQKRIGGSLNLTPYLQAKYRPFNNLYDLSGGLQLQSNRLTYCMGVNLGYYPKFTHEVQTDLELSIKYNLWQK